MKFAVSYSGGKESALALYRALKQEHEPVLLITTYNTDTGRSYSHGINEGLLEQISHALDIPLFVVKTSGDQYARNFENALQKAKELGAEGCVFGDIDIEGHRTWCSQRCENAGITPLFPLWGETREKIVHESIDSGFAANVTIVNTKFLSDDFLGQRLTREVAARIASCGADICGENGEYHTLVSDGPIFKQTVNFEYGEKTIEGDYAMLPLKDSVVNSHRFFSNTGCKYFPCHDTEGSPDEFNCLFCFCPLYAMGDKCGGKFTFDDKGIKCCMDCDLPHKPEYYDIVIGKLKEWKLGVC